MLKSFQENKKMGEDSNIQALKKPKRGQNHWQRQLRYLYYRFLRLRGSQQEIARGLAAGVFTGLFPIFGLQIAAGILLAILVKGNKIMAAAGTWISNPLTSIPLFFINYQVGCWLLGYSYQSIKSEDFQSWETIAQLGNQFMTALIVGCFFMGTVCAIVSYFLCLWLLKRTNNKQRRKLKHLNKYNF